VCVWVTGWRGTAGDFKEGRTGRRW
jgi:hypothetical protein